MKFKKEISSGGIVYHQKGGKIQILVLKDPKNNWTFPKGLIEKDEEKLLTAKREIKEEVGVDNIEYRADLGSVGYMYSFKDTLIDKTVYYFLFEIVGTPTLKVQKEEGIQEAKFIDLDKAFAIIGYKKTNVPVLKKIQDIFKEKKTS